MTCLLNTYGQISNINNVLDYLKEEVGENYSDVQDASENSNFNKKKRNFNFFQ